MKNIHFSNIIQKENRYKELLEQLNVIVYEFDLAEHRFTYVNKQAESILGYKCDEWYSKGFWYDHLHPDDRKKASEYSRMNTRLNRNHELEYRMIAADGSVKWFKDITSVISENGVPEILQGVIVDITEKKEYEEKLKETGLRLSSLFNNLHDIVFYESSKEGTFITDNVFDMLGYPSKELSENKGLFFSLIHPDDVQIAKSTFETWRKLEKNSFSKIELRLKRKDGKYIWIEDRMFAAITPNRSYWAGFMVDITERKQSETKLNETENRLSSLLNNLSDIVFYENENKLVFISDNVFEMLGYKANEFIENKRMFSKLVNPEDYRQVYDGVDEWIKKGETGSIKSEFRLKKKDGTYIWVEDLMFAVNSNSRKYWAGFFYDVSARKCTEEKLKEASTRLSTIINNLSNLTVYETGGGRNYVSENIEKLTGIPISEYLNDNKLFSKLIHPSDKGLINTKIREWHRKGATGVISTEFRIKHSHGDYLWIEDHMFKVKNEKGKEYLSGIMIDITEKKRTLEKITDTELRLSTVLSNLPKIVIYQAGNEKDFISENISEMIGYTPEEIFKEKYFFGKIMHADDLPVVINMLKEWKNINDEKNVLNMEYRLKKKDGDYIWIEDHMFKVNHSTREPYFSGILIDVTERKLTEKNITESLKEKEILLKEIHHRVKNNLQVVSSLLKLQSKSLKDNAAINILLESQNRIHSMALVHQKLYQSKDFANVDFQDYVKQLTLNLMDVYKYNSRQVQLNFNSDEILIGVDIAIPCGLIINELVSNALKYAFVNREKGKIDLFLNNLSCGNYAIIVKDDGIGFPKEINFKKTKSLGLQLVNTLVKQIDASIDMNNSTGTEFIISFTDPSQSIQN